jgi:uncharacterized protein with HEPN domain
MRGRVGDEQRLTHILEAINEIEKYLNDIDLTEFKNNSMVRFASIKQVEIIGEAAKNLTEETKISTQILNGDRLRGLRDILVHEYFGIDADLIWQILGIDIPDLKSKLKQAKLRSFQFANSF